VRLESNNVVSVLKSVALEIGNGVWVFDIGVSDFDNGFKARNNVFQDIDNGY
jgi:hypothetical protein